MWTMSLSSARDPINKQNNKIMSILCPWNVVALCSFRLSSNSKLASPPTSIYARVSFCVGPCFSSVFPVCNSTNDGSWWFLTDCSVLHACHTAPDSYSHSHGNCMTTFNFGSIFTVFLGLLAFDMAQFLAGYSVEARNSFCGMRNLISSWQPWT